MNTEKLDTLPTVVSTGKQHRLNGLSINDCPCCNRDGTKRTRGKYKRAKRKTLRKHRTGR